MESNNHHPHDINLVRAEGQLMGGPETFELSDQIENLYRGGHNKIVLDLSNVSWANSHAIGMIIRWFVSVRENGGDIKFSGLNKWLQSYMSMTNLLSVIPTFTSVDEAVQSFRQPMSAG